MGSKGNRTSGTRATLTVAPGTWTSETRVNKLGLKEGGLDELGSNILELTELGLREPWLKELRLTILGQKELGLNFYD